MGVKGLMELRKGIKGIHIQNSKWSTEAGEEGKMKDGLLKKSKNMRGYSGIR
jgi:hypothetical protein